MSDGAHSSTTKTALIVDDDPILREIMAAKLKEAGFAVDCVEDGEVACDRLDSERYSLALVDLNMPRLDGFGLLRHIRQNPRTVDLPVIVVTANDDRTSIEKAYALGASSFMTKPVNWSQFIHHIRFVTRSGETEQALRRAQAEAEAASRMKNGLFHLLSHELRTPVSVLVGFAGLLESTLGRRTTSSRRIISITLSKPPSGSTPSSAISCSIRRRFPAPRNSISTNGAPSS
jgi:CheY-like chemotaxis protein